jgi:hypothetical protein
MVVATHIPHIYVYAQVILHNTAIVSSAAQYGLSKGIMLLMFYQRILIRL